MKRREFLTGAAALGLAATGIARPAVAQASQVLKFVPQADLAVLDPIASAAIVTRNHAALVFDMLYGVDDANIAHPQMVEGHIVEDGGKLWTMKLRPGLLFHDGSPVLARDVIASLRRWAKRDSYGDALFQNTDELSAADDRTIKFRLRAPMTNLPYILGKDGPYLAVIMPERLAQNEVTKPVIEMVGSGPFRFLPEARVSGSLVAYEKFERYVPRADGTPNFLSGPKLVKVDRVEWRTMPDPATAVAALQTGEIDWWERPTVDLLPLIERRKELEVRLTLIDGAQGVLKFNFLTPPFDNPAVRRALLPALEQASFMMAARGEKKDGWKDGIGFFQSASPYANANGIDAVRGARSLDKAKALLKDSGYKNEPVVLLMPSDYFEINALAEVAADLMQSIGMKVDRQVTDWGTVIQRIQSQKPIDQGGWSAFTTTLPGNYTFDPVVNWYLRGNGTASVGWPKSAGLEALRAEFLAATDEGQRKEVARRIQAQAFTDLPYAPLGEFYQPTAFSRRVRGVQNGFPVFWNISKT
jgi:peptide/nickel transport system substrate-binding protein